MNMLKKMYDKSIVITIYILLPIIEVITTVMKTYTNCTITLGMIYKTLFMLYCIFYILFVNKRNKKFNYTLIGIYIIYILISYFITTSTLSFESIANKLVIISRFTCFPIMVLFLYNYLSENHISIRAIGICDVIFGLIMIISCITNTAFASYSSGLSKGMSGWFNSGNEISVLFCLFLPVMIYLMIKYKKPIYILGFIFTSISLCLIGTKTGLIGLIISSVIFLTYSIIRYLNKNSKTIYEKMVIISTIYIVLVSLVIPITPAYKYIAEKFEINNTQNSQENNVIISSFIYNGREEDLKEQLEIYMNAPIREKLFGISDDEKLLTSSGEFNVIERDYYDIIFIHGIIGCALFFAPMIVILLDRFKYLKCNLKSVMLFLSILLGLGISYIAGHVLLSPTVAIYFSFIFVSICLAEDKEEKGKIIIYMPKLSLGGMERALINYLNMCNSLKKFDVTLVLGYVTDKKLLNELPNNLSIRLLCTRKWDILGKIQSCLNYIIELIYIMIYNYDISICYSYHHKVLSLITRMASQNTILFMHTDLIHSRTENEINMLNKKVEFEKFKVIVCVSDAAKKSMEELYPNYTGKLITIYNYINGACILEGAKEKVDTPNVNLDKISFINVSRHFERAKKISRIINSAAKLKKEGYDFLVYLVGDGENTKDYMTQIEKQNLKDVVYLLGRQNNPYKYMKNSNYLVISSDFEGYGIVIDEAKVVDIPIITTNIADAQKMVQGYGVVVENSENGIYTGMKKALNGEVKTCKTFDYLKFNKEIDEKFDVLFSFLLDSRKD